MPWEPFDLYAERYDRWFEVEPGRSIFPSEVAAIELLLNGTGPRRLEVGVGTGRFAKPLGITLGLDPALGVLRMAQRRDVEVVRGVGEALPIASASFDAVLFVATLCFLDDARAALREAVRVLSPGGAVAVADIIADSPWGRFYLEQKAAGHPFYAGATFYTLEQLYRLLEEVGLTAGGSASTPFRDPEAAKTVTEGPTPGIVPDASFVCLLAETG
jgi:ubiquinone/menaquinone biosynthesis C-methylase UbiE